MAGESRSDLVELSCVEHTKEAVFLEYDLVTGNENCGTGRVDGGVRQIVQCTEPCDDLLGRRDT